MSVRCQTIKFICYNTVRVGLGLGAKTTFADITTDTTVQTALSDAYGGNINKIDLWVGGLCEDPISGSQLGETFHHIVRDQFIRLRDGDPEWYERRLSKDVLRYVKKTKLKHILARCAGVKGLGKTTMSI